MITVGVVHKNIFRESHRLEVIRLDNKKNFSPPKGTELRRRTLGGDLKTHRISGLLSTKK